MKKTLFGTDGIRAKVGESPLTCQDLFTLGKAIGKWLVEKKGQEVSVILGHDTRESCYALKSALKSGLLLQGISIANVETLPTPAIVSICKHCKSDLGIMLTASHNPYQDNGIKLIDTSGQKICKKDEQRITELFYQADAKDNNYTTFGGEMDFEQIGQLVYTSRITGSFEPTFLKNLTIILDCANGATYEIAEEIFNDLGANVITIHDEPNGKNINKSCGATNPQDLQEAVMKHNAHIGFAFDGDGDRLTVINKHGDIKDGDDLLCLLADHPDYKKQTSIVGTIVTNYGLESYLHKKGKKLIRTKVGDKFVAQTLIEQNLLLGGEQSGHIILRDYLCSSDGILTALKLIETAQLTNNWDLKTFKKFPQITKNIPVKQKKKLESEPLASIIKEHKATLKNGAIVVRYSGTEKLLRVMVQEEDEYIASNTCSSLSEKLKIELG